MQSRPALPADAAAIAAIYNQGIENRVATFETRLRTADDVRTWFDGVHPVVVVEADGSVMPSPPPQPTGGATVMPASPSSQCM